MSKYLIGADVLGAQGIDYEVGTVAAGAPAIVVRVRDIPGLVKKQGGSAGALLQSITPDTMSNIVYGQMASKLASGLKDQGVDADVQVTSSPPTGPRPRSEFLRGAGATAGILGGGWLLWNIVSGLSHKRSR